jgi:hypothetical protein
MPAQQPLYCQNPVNEVATLSVANTNRDGTGTVVDLLTGGEFGTRISYIRVKAQSTTTAGMIRFFIGDGASGTALFWELPVTAIVPSGSVESWEGYINFEDVEEAETGFPFVLKDGEILSASTNNAEVFSVTVLGGDYVDPNNVA